MEDVSDIGRGGMSSFSIDLGSFRFWLPICFCSASHPVWSYKTCNRGYKT
jgi:hypothetical protein